MHRKVNLFTFILLNYMKWLYENWNLWTSLSSSRILGPKVTVIIPEHEIFTQAYRNGLRLSSEWTNPIGQPKPMCLISRQSCKLNALELHPESLRTTSEMGGIYLEAQWTVQTHAWLDKEGPWHHLSLSDYSAMPEGAKACNEITGSFYFLGGTLWGCCIRGGDKSKWTSQWGRQSELIHHSLYW